MRILLWSAMFACLPLTPAKAAQPIKESLVECAVLVELMLGEQSFTPGQNDMLDLYTKAATTMRNEATRRANEGYVTRTAAKKRDLWHQRWDAGNWDSPNNRQELTEWWTYCFKLAEHLNLAVEP